MTVTYTVPRLTRAFSTILLYFQCVSLLLLHIESSVVDEPLQLPVSWTFSVKSNEFPKKRSIRKKHLISDCYL